MIYIQDLAHFYQSWFINVTRAKLLIDGGINVSCLFESHTSHVRQVRNTFLFCQRDFYYIFTNTMFSFRHTFALASFRSIEETCDYLSPIPHGLSENIIHGFIAFLIFFLSRLFEFQRDLQPSPLDTPMSLRQSFPFCSSEFRRDPYSCFPDMSSSLQYLFMLYFGVSKRHVTSLRYRMVSSNSSLRCYFCHLRLSYLVFGVIEETFINVLMI